MARYLDQRFEWRLARTPCKNILRNRHCRKDVGPTDIEGEMRDGFRGLRPARQLIGMITERLIRDGSPFE